MEKVPAYILIAPVTQDAEEYRAIVTTHNDKPIGMMEIQQHWEDENGWVNVDWLHVTDDTDPKARFESWLSRRN
jgi:hypothetical protein